MRPSDDALAPDPVGSVPVGLSARTGGEGPRRFGPLNVWQVAATTLLAGAIIIGACSGDNLFRNHDNTPPTVSAQLAQSGVTAGSPLSVNVSASDNGGLALVGVRLVDSAQTVLATSSLTVTGPSADTTVSVTVPQTAPGRLSVVAFALDRYQNEGVSPPIPLALVDSPSVVIQVPQDSQTVSLTDPLQVRVHMHTAYVGIKTLKLEGVAIRTSPTSNTVVVTRYTAQTVTFPQPPSLQMPTDTTLDRYLVPLKDTTSERVSIVATVTDSTGRTAVDTAYIAMGGPQLRLDNPANGLRVGPSAVIPVSLHAQDASSGIDTVVVSVSGGAVPAVTSWIFNSRKTAIDTSTSVTAPASAATLVFTARTRNHIGLQAWVTDTVFVLSTAVADTFAPRVRLVAIDSGNAAQSGLMEQTDSIGVLVAAADSGTAGIRRYGITVQADTGGSAGPIASTQIAVDVSPPLTVPPQHMFYFKPSMLPQLSGDSTRLPRVVNFRVTAFAVDAATPTNNCAAGVVLGTDMRLPCSTFLRPGSAGVQDTVAASAAGYAIQFTLVAGRSIMLQALSKVADLAPDTLRGRLYIANMGLNEVEQLQIASNTLLTPIRAGSAPWGLDLYRDTMLVVANSGGTNISRISLSGATPTETSRLLTPNVTLWNYNRQKDLATGLYKWTITGPIDFSDRPQFLGQDSKDRVVYSTVPTGSAGLGTLRAAEKRTGWNNTETWLLNRGYGWDPDTSTFAFENADSVGLYSDGSISVFTHVPGDSAATWFIPPTDPALLCAQTAVVGSLAHFRAADSTMAYCAPGKWNLKKIGLSDTTFVAMARDRSHIAFGEGNSGSTGRIFMWNSTNDVISPDINVTDLVNNASERVVGLGLNMNGTLGVARGQLAGYFFDPNLRLQGEFGDIVSGTGGAAMDPHHADPYASNDSTLAFIGSQDAGRPVIKIVDTFSFRQRGEIFIHDNIIGLLKASTPMPSDASCTTVPANPNCVVLKLYGVTPTVTDANGQEHARIVVVDVRKSDILP